MDDIESSANPRWDADYHDYANGLDVLIDINGAGTGVDVFTTGDHNGGNTLASCTAPVLCMLQ